MPLASDICDMTITGQPVSLLDSVLDAASARNDMSVTLLKKAQDVEKQQGEAMVKLLEQSAPVLDAYA